MRALTLIAALLTAAAASAEPPSVSYIFPAGGQRGTTVRFRMGGHYLHDSCPFEMSGPGISCSARVTRQETIWFEGPRIPLPASQEKEDYPKDYAGEAAIADDAEPGVRWWRVWNSQGIVPSMKFVVGDLPEVVEEEIDGAPLPVKVPLPVTINGRIFPREDVDAWTFDARAGQVITCDVSAARLGMPLEARLELRDPDGNRIAESMDVIGGDPRLTFTAPTDGVYEARIHDVKFGGLQNYVYRLTLATGPFVESVFPLGGRRGSTVNVELRGANLPAEPVAVALPSTEQSLYVARITLGEAQTNPVTFELDDLPEVIEPAGASRGGAAIPVVLPVVLNGRIGEPDEQDHWSFEAKAGDSWEFDVRASRLGSPLDSVLTILDGGGKPLATADDRSDGQTDALLTWSAPSDGRYIVRVEDRLVSRGDSYFAYRLRVARRSASPDFELSIPTDAVIVERGAEVKLKVAARRAQGFEGEIALEFNGLPTGVTVSGASIPEKKSEAEVTLRAEKSAAVAIARVEVIGKSRIGETELVRRGAVALSPGEPPRDTLFLSVAMPTPFKFTAIYEQEFAPSGSVYVRHYQLDRGGFDGPLTVCLADRQVRHAQGVTGPVIELPAGAAEFDYPLSLAPFMEIGRTSRTNLMIFGTVVDADGGRHVVTFTTPQDTEQIVAITAPGRLSVTLRVSSVRARPGSRVKVPVRIGRENGLHGTVTVSLVVPRHIEGVEAGPVVIPDGEREGTLTLQFSAERLGPFNMPLTLRAAMPDERGYPVVGECPLVVAPLSPADAAR